MNTRLDTALMTVLQAREKWCPEARSTSAEYPGDVPPPTVNRQALGAADNGSLCLGDRCMFWRWHDRGERHQSPIARSRAHVVPSYGLISGSVTPHWEGKPDDGRDWLLDEEEGEWYIPSPPLPPRGYCGKAGHPHAAALVDAQLELAHYQLHEHRRA
ncbi:hypothetical protein MKK58_17640 [Methylobacterium sp. J-078]|uniref:hypothetical protein n=1 Tax=Methylobacterium sp. J-078 TaxID=2836657 RepID=UPI001FBB825E|nr:hypothetical protein [Methylobacterium sp. J-078]MCJ2046341.1 hypothetical protein [Methylobacterium sp. J-078]